MIAGATCRPRRRRDRVSFACVRYFRAALRSSARNLWLRGVLPLLGALLLTAAFFVSAMQMWDPGYGGTQIFGVGGAFASGVVLLALGVVLAFVCRIVPSTRGTSCSSPARRARPPRRTPADPP